MVAPLQNGCNCVGQILLLYTWMTASLQHCCGFFPNCWFHRQWQQYISVFNELLKMHWGGVQKTLCTVPDKTEVCWNPNVQNGCCPLEELGSHESPGTKVLLWCVLVFSAQGCFKDCCTQRTCPLLILMRASKLPPPLTLITYLQRLWSEEEERRENTGGRGGYPSVCLESSRTQTDRLESCFSQGDGEEGGRGGQWQFSSSITSMTMVLGPVRMRLLTVR